MALARLCDPRDRSVVTIRPSHFLDEVHYRVRLILDHPAHVGESADAVPLAGVDLPLPEELAAGCRTAPSEARSASICPTAGADRSSARDRSVPNPRSRRA